MSGHDSRPPESSRAEYFERFPKDRHALFAMVAPESMPAFEALVRGHGGALSMALNEAGLEAAGLPPASECAYNHTTLQVLKVDRGWTYLQVAYPQPFDAQLPGSVGCSPAHGITSNTSSPSTTTVYTGTAFVAGSEQGSPVRRSKVEPCLAHSSSRSSGQTSPSANE